MYPNSQNVYIFNVKGQTETEWCDIPELHDATIASKMAVNGRALTADESSHSLTNIVDGALLSVVEFPVDISAMILITDESYCTIFHSFTL